MIPGYPSTGRQRRPSLHGVIEVHRRARPGGDKQAFTPGCSSFDACVTEEAVKLTYTLHVDWQSFESFGWLSIYIPSIFYNPSFTASSRSGLDISSMAL